MKPSSSLVALLLSVNISQASSLDVYQDKTFYRYIQENNFIGFSQRVQARCEGSPMALTAMSTYPEEERLSKILTTIRDTEHKLEANTATEKVLAQLISLPQPTTFDVLSWIESAKLLGTEQSRLSREKKLLQKEVDIQRRNFQKQAPTQQASKTSTICKKEIELTIPYRFVSFSTRYEANLKNENEISVTQYLSVINRSGINIHADTAMFYYRSVNQGVSPTHFRPWIASKYVPRPQKVSKVMKRSMVNVSMMADEVTSPAPFVERSVANYEDAREYKIKNLSLHSTGVATELPLLNWKATVNCEVRAYPYTKRQAFHVCSFRPKYQIDSHTWKIKSDSQVINDTALGEYSEGKYQLYTKVEEDIKIERKAMVKKERETGIFGGTARKKDGFTLTLMNKSDKVKTLTIVERIPISTTDEIKVKLLEVKSDKKIDYKMLKDGKIEIKISLAGNETKRIEVLFEISYDKELKVNY